MPGYSTRISSLAIGGHLYEIRSLSTQDQYADPQGQADRAGISSAQWGLFGQLWPAGRALALLMHDTAVEGRRVLEIGCGLALSSLVLARRGADITASDHHPLAEAFLAYNAGLNRLPMPVYRDLPWDAAAPELGQFDLIIGSDILYERGHPAAVASLLARLARPHAEIIISDPGRGHDGHLGRALRAQGYVGSSTPLTLDTDAAHGGRGRLLRFVRAA